MNEEKISFAYPTLIVDGLRTSGFYPPTIVMNLDGNNRDKPRSLVITAGFILDYVGVYYMEVGIYHNNESIITRPDNKGRIDTVLQQIIPNGPVASVYMMHVDGVVFLNSGLHKAVVKVYRSKGEEREDLPSDEHECTFYVFHRDDENGK